jgi:hypothetical protein
MAESDWTIMPDSASSSVVRRAVTNGVGVPSGGGSFVYGFNSQDTSDAVVAYFTNLTNFAPTAANKGGRVTGVLRRGLSGGTQSFAPFLFAACNGTSIASTAYMIGLADGDPAHIVVRKGALTGGLPDNAPLGNGVLMRSTGTVAVDEWVHLRLDVIVNINGDVRLQAYRNNLGTNPIGGAFAWAAIPGMSEFVDDALGVNSGSLPYTGGGRLGFGFWSTDVNRRGYVDHVEVYRQL